MKRFHNYLAYGQIKPPSEEVKKEEKGPDLVTLAVEKLQ